jgi:hypothetical protein
MGRSYSSNGPATAAKRILNTNQKVEEKKEGVNGDAKDDVVKTKLSRKETEKKTWPGIEKSGRIFYGKLCPKNGCFANDDNDYYYYYCTMLGVLDHF